MDILLTNTFQKTPSGSWAIEQHQVNHALPIHSLKRRFSKVQHAGLVNQTLVEMSFEISWASQICSQVGKGETEPLQFLSPCFSDR